MVGLLKRQELNPAANECNSNSSVEISSSNSDVLLTEHAVRMMLRREINSNDLIDAIYNPDQISEGRGIDVFIRTAKIGISTLEVVCRPVPSHGSSYLIKVITVHKS
ncbi:MAG: DUF4258 domain-containing protein [Candidatus Micrarchaeaceae archaeon]